MSKVEGTVLPQVTIQTPVFSVFLDNMVDMLFKDFLDDDNTSLTPEEKFLVVHNAEFLKDFLLLALICI